MGNVVAIADYRETDPASDIKWTDEHARLIQMFEESEDATRTNTRLAERDVDYYDGKQWTELEVKKLRKRGQAALMDNHIKPKIRFLQGLEQTKRTDPKASPRTPQHEQDANSCTDALRFVCDQNKLNRIRSRVFKDILAAGWGGFEVTVEERPGQMNPVVIIRRCPWDRMGADPYSSEDDFTDASYRFLVRWMDREEAIAEYGDGADKVFDETVSFGQQGGYFDDKPKQTTWVSYNRRWRVRVVQCYFKHYQSGEVCFAEYTKGGLLRYGPSPWLDEFGQTEDPYVWGSANVDRDNNRYGEIRHLIDLQDGINHRTSKFQHLISTRQTFRTEQALGSMSPQELRRQLAKPDGDIVLAPNVEFGKHFGIIPTGDMADKQFELLQSHEARFQAQGPNASLLGRGPSDQSGRAILANQQGGSIEASPVYDVLHDMDLQLYRKIWNRIRQYWTAEQWVRVTDDMQNLRWVGLNVPAIDPSTGQPAIDPMTGQPKLQNQLSALDVDIELDEVPHVGTMQDEEFGKMVDLAKVVPALQQMPAPVWIEASNLRNKAKLSRLASQMAQPDPARQQAQQIQLAGEAAKVEETKSKTALNFSRARSEGMPDAPGEPEYQLPPQIQAVQAVADVRDTNASAAYKEAQAAHLNRQTTLAPIEFAHDVFSRDADREARRDQSRRRGTGDGAADR